MTGDVYISTEGRTFGLDDRVRVLRPIAESSAVVREMRSSVDQLPKMDVLYEPKLTLVFTLPVLRARLWGLLHGYGWLPVR